MAIMAWRSYTPETKYFKYLQTRIIEANFMTAQKQREEDAMRLHTEDSKYAD